MKINLGGRLQGISLDAFLQMAQMEQISCTLSVVSGENTGALFLKNGTLISADTGDLSPLDAAHRIISWDQAVIDIAESCDKTVDEIKQPLMNILMEAMRLRDDAKNDPPLEPTKAKTVLPLSKSAPQKSTVAAQEPSGTAEAAGAVKKASSPKSNTRPRKKAPSPILITDPPKRLPWKLIVAGLAVLIAGIGLGGFFLFSAKQTRIAYETLLQTVEIADGTTEKLALLNTYARENQGGKYSTDVNRRIEELLEQKNAREFENIEQSAFRLEAEGDIEAAMAVYETYLKDAGKNAYRDRTTRALQRLSAQVDTENFEEMKRVAMAQGPERISTYRAFLEKHPDSSYREEVLKLVFDMEEEYYIFLERRFLEKEASGSLAKTIELGQQFIDAYPGSDHLEAVNKMLANCRSEFSATLSFAQLQTRASALGTDYESARIVYQDYLKAYPGSPVREKIEREIDLLTELAEKERLSRVATQVARTLTESGTRFNIVNNETVLDTSTGLMWCLLDSQTSLNKCLAYDKATAYVEGLETGGYNDWRLPTLKELSVLHQKKPYFPSEPERWYWSSETEKKYAGQWIILVKGFQPGNANGRQTVGKESWQCGSVRAVRRP